MKLITEINESVEYIFEEDKDTGKKNYFIEGVFMQGDIKNRNGRMYPGTADLVIGADPQVSTSVNVMRYVSKNTITLLNLKASTSGQIIEDRDWEFNVPAAEKLLRKHSKKVQSFNATDYAKKLTGYSLMVNMLMLGHAYEQGLLPVREESMMQAIEANGTMVDTNKKAWQMGRCLAT